MSLEEKACGHRTERHSVVLQVLSDDGGRFDHEFVFTRRILDDDRFEELRHLTGDLGWRLKTEREPR